MTDNAATTTSKCQHKYQYHTGVFKHDTAPKKSRKGENIRACMCEHCQSIPLDDRIQNKCPSCGKFVKIINILDDQGFLAKEICPVCDARARNGQYLKYFYGNDCPLCKKSEKIIDSLEKRGIHIEKYNATSEDNADDVAEASLYMVQGLPTLILLDRQGEPLDRWSGDISQTDVVSRIGQ